MEIQSNILHEQGLVANPAPLGLCATAIANWATGVANCGWVGSQQSVGISIFYGGLAQFVAGLWSFKRKDTLGALAFCTYGAWWTAIGVFGLFFASPKTQYALSYSPDELVTATGWMLVTIFVSNCYFLICSIQKNPVTIANFFWLGLSELLIFIGLFKGESGGEGCVKAGGAVQIVLAAFCFYAAFAQTWNDMAGKNMIPLGSPVLDLTEKKSS